MQSLCSTHYLLHKLRSIEKIKPDIFKEIFSSYRDCLAAGLEYYNTKKSKSVTEEDLIKQFGIDESAANFVCELSKTLDIDLEICYELFTAYLLYDYTGPTRDMKAIVGDADKRKVLLVEFVDYFYSEQVCLLLSIVEILKIVQKPGSQLPNTALLKRFVFDAFATQSFVDKLLACLKTVWRKFEEQPPQVGFRRDVSALVRHYFILQENLVRVLIWLFYVADLPVECDVAVLNFFVEQNFGRKQFYKKFLPSTEADDRVDRIFSLEILFTLKVFHLESLLFLHYEASGDRESYWLDDHKAQKVVSILEPEISPTSRDHAGLALAYALNLQLRRMIFSRDNSSSEVDSLNVKTAKYGSIARRNNCLHFCGQLLGSSAIANDPDLQSLARAVIYVALDGCLEFFEADSLGTVEELTHLLCDVLKDESVAEVFWSKNFASGASLYLLNQLYQFCACFERPLRILSSLASASLESCQKVTNFWRKVPVVSEPMENVDPRHLAMADDVDDMQEGNETTTVVLLKSRTVGNGGPSLPVGTRGLVLRAPGAAKELVQWDCSYNAWQLCHSEATKSHPNLTHVSLILKLVAGIMETDPSSVALFVHFLKASITLLKRCVFYEVELPVSVLEPCFGCLAIAAKTFPYEVLSQMSQAEILPIAAGSGADVRQSLLTRVLNDVERLSGSYDCTISFLRLVESCSDDVACYELPCFLGSVSYVCHNVFADFLTWRCEKEEQRNEIANICLRILRKILEKWTTEPAGDSASVNKVATVCRSALTQSEARRVLLRLACVGVDALKDAYDQLEDWESQGHIVDTVRLSLALLLELFVDFEKSKGSTMPQLFFDFLAVSPTSGVPVEPPLCSIGRYLFLRTNDQIPKLAIICLRRIAKLFQAVMLSALGEWSPAFCDALLTRLESPMEDVHLKVNCVEFLAATVEYQPGLAEQLLGVSRREESVGDAPVEKRSKLGDCDGGALHSVLCLLKGERLQPELAVACVNLFATIWRVNNTAAIDYLRSERKEEFWTTLLAPLSAGEENYFLAIVSPIFRILTRELFSNGGAKVAALAASSETTIVTTVVKEITDSERIKLTFKKLQAHCESRIEQRDKVEVVSAWTDFLHVFFRTASSNNSASEILEGSILVLKTVLTNFESANDLATVKAASDLCSLALKYCGRTAEKKGLIKQFEPIIYRLNDASVDEWVLTLSSIVLPACCSLFQTQQLAKDDMDILPSVFDTLCSLLVKILINTAMLRSRDMLSSSSYPWRKALQYSLHCVALMFSRGLEVDKEKEKYITVIQKHSVFRNLRVLAASLLEAGCLDSKLFASMCLVFEMAAGSSKSLSMIGHSGFLEWICVKLVIASKEVVFDADALTALFNLFSSIMETGAHNAVCESATFVASYFDIIAELLFSLPTSSSASNGKAVLALLRLLIFLARYKERWHFEAGESQASLIDAVSILCFRLPPYLSKPTALAEVISKAKSSQSDPTSAISTPANVDPKILAIQHTLLEVLFSGIQFLLCFSPDLADVCNNPSFDAESFRPLLGIDLNTNIAPDITPKEEPLAAIAQYPSPPLTFGAVLLTIHSCVNQLRKPDGAKSASPSVHPVTAHLLLKPSGERSTVAALLDCSLYFILSQAALYLVARQDGLLDDWQRALLKRDLAAELSVYLSRSGIRASGGSAPSTPGKSPTSTPSVTSPGLAGRTSIGLDVQFLRFASDFVRDVLRNND